MIYAVSTVLLISLYVNWNLFRKNEALEDANEESFKFVSSVRNSLIQILQNIKSIDSKSMFEKDDDVGGPFDMSKKEIKKLENAFDDDKQ